MNVMKRLRPIAVAAGVMLAVVACGGNGASSGTSNKGTIVIGADVPLNGTDASQGQPIANGAELAIQKQGSIDGFKLQFKDYDDAVNGTHDPSKGAQNVQAMAGDAQILGMIGPLNSNVGQAEIPIAAQNTLPMISPATTNQCLTRDDLNCNGAASALRKGNPNPFFRIVTIDTNQGPAMAYYAYNQLKLRKIAVGDDNETYGLGIANAFAAEFKKLGGQVVQQQNFDWQSTQDYTPFLQKAKNAGAQGIYWGGVTATNSCVPRQEMASVGFTDTTPYMGGDGIIQDPNCVKAAGAMAPGTYATIAAINPQQVPAAKSAISAYNKQFGSQNYTAYAIVSYAATQVMINAIDKAIKANNGNKPTRKQVLAQLAKTKNFASVVGPIGFDSHGDNTTKIVSVYQYTSADATQAANEPYEGAYNFGKTPPVWTAAAS